jgi:hypothetical protein
MERRARVGRASHDPFPEPLEGALSAQSAGRRGETEASPLLARRSLDEAFEYRVHVSAR